MDKVLEAVLSMKGETVHNYVIAGLNSTVLTKGLVRLFENTRMHEDAITPHSHRFDFTCIVLEGEVTNITWRRCREEDGDLFQISELTYKGYIGSHTLTKLGLGHFNPFKRVYRVGDTYRMSSDEIHSIRFGRGTKVLFFEEPYKTDKSVIIEPIVDGVHIPTYEVKEYMFIRGE
jgi:hypothetical protein